MRETNHREGRTTAGLHVCAGCSSPLVQPTCWEQTEDNTRWKIWRRCPDCGWTCEGIYGEQEIEAFDEELDLGTRELAEELKELERSNMEQMVKTFTSALAADLICADDFS